MRIGKIDSQQNFNGLYVKPSANKTLEALFEKTPYSGHRRVEYAKIVGSLQDKMKDNPVKIFIESNKEYWWGLKATVLGGYNKPKQVFTQKSAFNYDFIKEAVANAAIVKKVKAISKKVS